MKANRKEELGKEIVKSLKQWKCIKLHGAGDPFWSDGINMGLVRNHIIYFKRKCEEELDGDYPQEYYLATPPEVSKSYMTRAGEIRAKAKLAERELPQGQLTIFDIQLCD